MIKPENEFINESVIMYLRDAYDHIIEIVETLKHTEIFLQDCMISIYRVSVRE
jgi:Mg2+ and Co2+ transporter CorA